jgi:hypothetical protein
MANEFDISDIPVEGQSKPVSDPGTSVLSPNYRARDPFGAQELGGLIGGVGGSFLGPIGSVVGAGLGGALGEAYEQISKDEQLSPSRIGLAGAEEAAWDAGGNLVLRGAGKVLRFGAEKLGFSQKDIPDANKAAQTFLDRQGSSLPMSARTGSNIDQAIEGLVYTPATFDIFKRKQQEIYDALARGQKDVLKQFPVSAEFESALRSGTSAQRASGEVLQSFIKQGEQSLSEAVDPIYKDIFKDTESRISMFGIKQWAQKELSDPAALTKGQQAILKEMETLPPQVDISLLHRMRSRWLAENRDKYSSLGTEKDSRAASTITNLVKQFDEAMDFTAGRTLSKDTYSKYKQVTDTYRKGIQGLNTEAVQTAMSKNPEEVGAYLFAAGNETPVKQLYQSIAAAGTLSKKSSQEVINALRIGYLDALTHTPENMLKFAKELEQNKNMKNTYDVLFGGTPQKEAIEAMNNAAKLGLVEPTRQPGLNYRTASALANIATTGAALGTGYAFLLSPEQQQRIKDNFGEAALAGGALILSQRKLAKVMLDPKGAKAIKYLSTAKDKLSSPTAFTKLVVEPIANILNSGTQELLLSAEPENYDISNIPVK